MRKYKLRNHEVLRTSAQTGVALLLDQCGSKSWQILEVQQFNHSLISPILSHFVVLFLSSVLILLGP